MNKDRIAGSAKHAKGVIEEAAGKLTGDAKLRVDGKADKIAGNVQNLKGGIADSVKR